MREGKKYVILGSLCALLVTMTVAYAAFQSSLQLKGTSNITSKWDILITDVEEINKGGDAITTEKEGKQNPSWDGLTANIEADLTQKGDFIEYEITIENRGTLDAKLNEIRTNTIKEHEAILINFEGYTKGEKLAKGTSQKIIVRIEYNPNFDGIPEIGSKEINIELEYNQNDDYNKEENGEISSPDRYLVTYDCTTNGGEKCTSYNEYLKEGENVNLTNQGTNKKYDFIGWNTDPTAREGLTELQMTTEEVTLYAIYETDPIIRSWTSADASDFHSNSYKQSIISAEFLDHKNVPENATESWDVSAAGDKSVMAWVVPDSTDNTKHHLYIGGKGGVIANENSSYLFYEFTNITALEFHNNFDTSNVINMYCMFYHLDKLTTLDLSGFDTGNVTDMSHMFSESYSLKELNVSSFDTGNVTNMSHMFYDLKNISTLDLSNFNTSKVTDMSAMFSMWGFRNESTKLTYIDVSNFDTSSLTQLWDFAAFNRSLIKIKLCSFDTSKVTNMQTMFRGTSSLEKVYVGPNWTMANVTNSTNMWLDSKISSVTQSNNCEVEAEEPATIELATSTTTNSITVVVDATAPSGIAKYEYQINGGEWIESTENIYTFTGLELNTDYSIKVRVTSKIGKQTIKTIGVPLDSMLFWGKSDNPNNTDTVLADKSGKGNNGILHGFNKTETSGYNNEILKFDGIDDYVDLGLANYDFKNSITYVMNVKIDNKTDDDIIFGNHETAGGGFVATENKFRFELYNGSEYVKIYDTTSIDVNKYYILIGTYDGNNFKFYIDGILIGSKNLSSLKTSIVPMFIGANPGTNGHTLFTNMSLKEAMLYDRALTEEEVKNLTNKFNNITNTTTKIINPPTFEETENETNKNITITYPEGCGDKLTCSYQKDEGDWIEVNDQTKDIIFSESGVVVAKVTDGNNEITASHTVVFEGNNLEYSGEVQTFTADKDGYYKVELWGAQGGSTSSATGGNGTYTSGEIYLNQGDNLYIYIGGQGQLATTDSTRSAGGFNGGGQGYKVNSTYPGAGGGGATDIRLIDGNWDDATSLNSRIMVAAGGGGVSYVNNGATGGALIGTYFTAGSTGGLQTSGGTPANLTNNGIAGGFGYGGNSGVEAIGGGGSGYYGGAGASQSTSNNLGAPGGSSYISGYAGVNSITSESDRTHTNQTKHYSDKYFINTEMQAGVNSGDGKAKITYLKTPSSKDSTKIKGVRYIKDCINGSSANTANHWVELQAINNGTNVAKGKTVTGTHDEYYSYSRIVDGKMDDTGQYAEPTTGGTVQCITVDLGKEYDLEEIAVWHYYGDGRTYKNNTISVAGEDKDYKVLTLENTPETSNGLHIKSAKSKGFHTSGSCTYYIDNGKLATKWLDLGADKLYYFDNEGCMKKSAWINAEYTDSTGISCASKWYYANSEGKMHTGWLHLGTYWYYLAKKDGKENKWNTVQPRGCMYTGWVYSEDYACATHGWYFNPAPGGDMAHDTTINGSTLNSSGCWVQ